MAQINPFIYFVCLLLPIVSGKLQDGFYSSTCPQAEVVVHGVVQTWFSLDPSITAALLRMHFHDCFVRGCDASILIDTTTSEKTAVPNLTVRGYNLIEAIKVALEAQCPSTVSCADIIAMATRDSVAFAGGPIYSVPTGRRDGLISNAAEVILPGPQSSVHGAFELFKARGLTLDEMVTLLGAHTVGVSHCAFFQDRILNFQNTGAPDQAMDPSIGNMLARACQLDSTVALDQGSMFMFDNSFYKQIMSNRAILTVDQGLGKDISTRGMVSSLASNDVQFRSLFAEAMVKLGSVGVLFGNAGEVRKSCGSFN